MLTKTIRLILVLNISHQSQFKFKLRHYAFLHFLVSACDSISFHQLTGTVIFLPKRLV